MFIEESIFSIKALIQKIDFFHFQGTNLKRKKQPLKMVVLLIFLNIPYYMK